MSEIDRNKFIQFLNISAGRDTVLDVGMDTSEVIEDVTTLTETLREDYLGNQSGK